jgi:GTP:adenosylcobinamide-phosphate guanylyltransferase
MSEQKHTQEPWIAEQVDQVIEICNEETLFTVAKIHTFGEKERAEANARRIVACVNALAGATDEQIEQLQKSGLVGTLNDYAEAARIATSQRDELLAAVKRAHAYIDDICYGLPRGAESHKAFLEGKALREAIAKVESK